MIFFSAKLVFLPWNFFQIQNQKNWWILKIVLEKLNGWKNCCCLMHRDWNNLHSTEKSIDCFCSLLYWYCHEHSVIQKESEDIKSNNGNVLRNRKKWKYIVWPVMQIEKSCALFNVHFLLLQVFYFPLEERQ